jgi:hypothetical protein
MNTYRAIILKRMGGMVGNHAWCSTLLGLTEVNAHITISGA